MTDRRRVCVLFLAATFASLPACSRALLSSGLDLPNPQELIDDRKFTWSADSAGTLRLYVDQSVQPSQQVTVERMEAALALVDSTLGLTPDPRPISVFVVGSADRMNDLLGRRVDGRSFYQTGVAAIVADDDMDATAKHELTHVMLGRQWGKAREDWISEGVATWVGNPYYGRDLARLARDRLVRTGRVIPLSSLAASFGRVSDEVMYLQSASIAQFMARRFGVAAVRTVWQHGITSIPTATRMSMESFESAWRQSLEQTR